MDDVNIHIERLILDPGEMQDQGALSETIQRQISGQVTMGYSDQVADAVAGTVHRAVAEAGHDR